MCGAVGGGDHAGHDDFAAMSATTPRKHRIYEGITHTADIVSGSVRLRLFSK